MKIVFLDIDGVLNHRNWFARRPTPRRFSLDPDCVNRIEKACASRGANVVVSSSWRTRMSPNHLARLLAHGGLSRDRIVGMTPKFFREGSNDVVLEVPRGREIQRWLNDTGEEIEKFAIVDDSSDMEHLLPYLVQTNPEIGITDDDIHSVISLLD